MAKVHRFRKRDRNRYRKVYRYIRKRPSFEFCSNAEFEMIAGFVDFADSVHDSISLVIPWLRLAMRGLASQKNLNKGGKYWTTPSTCLG